LWAENLPWHTAVVVELETKVSDISIIGVDVANWHMSLLHIYDRLCGLVVRVLGYRSGGLGSIPGTTRKKK
jgi:hypothetical protein